MNDSEMRQKIAGNLGTALVLVLVGILAERTLSLRFTLRDMEAVRIGFGSLPIILGGLFLGPWWGAFIGGSMDLIGYTLQPSGPYLPQITLVSMLFGIIPGFLAHLIGDTTRVRSLAIQIGVTQIICSLILMPVILYQAFGVPLVDNMTTRLIIQLVTIPIYVGIAYLLINQWESSKALRESEWKYRLIFERSPIGIIHFDQNGVISECNDALVSIIGSFRTALLGLNMLNLPDENVVAAVKNVFKGQEDLYEGVYHSVTANKKTYLRVQFAPFIANDKVTGGVGIAEDISEQMCYQEKLEYLSLHDRLTGLYNRVYLEEEMSRLTKSREFPVTIIAADIDSLKLVNDTMGHARGDELLSICAHCLSRSLRGSDILARVGGDEFAVILPHTDEKTALEIRDRIRANIKEYNSEHPELPLHISMGVVTATEQEDSLEEAYNKADDLMYYDKLLRHNSSESAVKGTMSAALADKGLAGEIHREKLTSLCRLMGERAGLNSDQIEALLLLARNHDLGIASIPRSILLKKQPLTDEEWAVMKQHPEHGFTIASISPDLSNIAELILKHHEHWDGSGYPLGLKEEEIPIECRIFAVANTYCVTTGKRAYCRTLSSEEALDQIRWLSGNRFDPEVVELFVELADSKNFRSYISPEHS
ncbi:MAG: folate family ECF transporter S component [Bacillota bacterium]|nr:folate family ECF transporter S component [Bacillota bacterium]